SITRVAECYQLPSGRRLGLNKGRRRVSVLNSPPPCGDGLGEGEVPDTRLPFARVNSDTPELGEEAKRVPTSPPSPSPSPRVGGGHMALTLLGLSHSADF